MGNAFSRKGYAAWLCAVLLACCLVAGVPGVQVAASDDVANPGTFREIYTNNYDAIMGDYGDGYVNIAFVDIGSSISTSSCCIMLSKEPLQVSYNAYQGRNFFKVSEGTDVHIYRASGLTKPSGYFLYSYYASSYDILNDGGRPAVNVRHLPDWFKPGNPGIPSNVIPRCGLVPDYYNKEGKVVYYYYKDYPEYAFCTVSDESLCIINEYSDDTGKARKYIGRVSDGKISGFNSDHDKTYIFSAKLRTWQPLLGSSFSKPVNFLGTAHTLNSANGGNNFTIVASNCAMTQFDFDSAGNLLFSIPVSTGPISGNMSFPKAPAPELVGTVRAITWSRMMAEVVGLIPLLAGLVISFLGLRKGLAVLWHRLRRG